MVEGENTFHQEQQQPVEPLTPGERMTYGNLTNRLKTNRGIYFRRSDLEQYFALGARYNNLRAREIREEAGGQMGTFDQTYYNEQMRDAQHMEQVVASNFTNESMAAYFQIIAADHEANVQRLTFLRDHQNEPRSQDDKFLEGVYSIEGEQREQRRYEAMIQHCQMIDVPPQQQEPVNEVVAPPPQKKHILARLKKSFGRN